MKMTTTSAHREKSDSGDRETTVSDFEQFHVQAGEQGQTKKQPEVHSSGNKKNNW